MNPVLFVTLGLAAGILSGIFGIGGATLMIPVMVYLLGFTQHQAQGTTLAAMVPPIGLLAAWRYWQAGNVKLSAAAFICAGFFIGGFIGANLIQGVNDTVLKKAFGVFLLFVSLRMVLGK